MTSECNAAVSDVSPAEVLGKLVRSSVVEAVASKDPACSEYGSADDAEFQHGSVEVLGAGRAVDAVLSEPRGEQFLVGLHGKEVDFPCDVLSHVLKIPSVSVLFNVKSNQRV